METLIPQLGVRTQRFVLKFKTHALNAAESIAVETCGNRRGVKPNTCGLLFGGRYLLQGSI